MATIQNASPRPWRMKGLLLASFKGAYFHVEQQGRSSGRRTVVHEYPKRDVPFSEDMGRHAIRYQMTGYVIEMDRRNELDYQIAKNRLIRALDSEDAGELRDPYRPATEHLQYAPLIFMCERYTVTETRERGGFATFEMMFVEAGIAGNSFDRVTQDTAQTTQTASLQAMNEAEAYGNRANAAGVMGLR
jgi:prophage DNA circulation protein